MSTGRGTQAAFCRGDFPAAGLARVLRTGPVVTSPPTPAVPIVPGRGTGFPRQGPVSFWVCPTLAGAQGMAIEHEPVSCLIADKHPRLLACFAPRPEVSRARVYFRATRHGELVLRRHGLRRPVLRRRAPEAARLDQRRGLLPGGPGPVLHRGAHAGVRPRGRARGEGLPEGPGPLPGEGSGDGRDTGRGRGSPRGLRRGGRSGRPGGGGRGGRGGGGGRSGRGGGRRGVHHDHRPLSTTFGHAARDDSRQARRRRPSARLRPRPSHRPPTTTLRPRPCRPRPLRPPTTTPADACAGDTAGPEVEITSPGNGPLPGLSAALTAQASDPGGVAEVRFYYRDKPKDPLVLIGSRYRPAVERPLDLPRLLRERHPQGRRGGPRRLRQRGGIEVRSTSTSRIGPCAGAPRRRRRRW